MVKKNPLAVILGLSVLFFMIFLVIAVSTVMNLTSSGKTQKKLFGKSNNIGIIELKGVIMDSKKALDQIEGFSEDPLIKGVVIHINSPGGAVAPSQEIYEAVRRLSKKKPTYASMSSLAASGGYYVAVATKKIYANPGTITGSIGVIMQFADLSKLYQWAKVNQYSIKTGRYKDVGSPSREMSLEEKALLQEMVDNVLSQFRKAVAAGRNLPMEKVIELSDGRIFSGEQAKNVKLVDELGGIEETIEAVAKEAGIVGKPNVVYATKKRAGWERLLGDLDEENGSESQSGSRLLSLFRAALGVVNSGVLTESMPAAASPKLVGPQFLLPLSAE